MKSFFIATSVVLFLFGVVWLQIPVATAAYTYKDRSLQVRTTAYTHSESDHLIYGRKTAVGTQLKFTREYTSAASDWSRFPVGTEFRIKGINRHFVIDDYGSALLGKDTIDIYFPSRSRMNRWGVQHVDIIITKYGDFDKSREILSGRTKYHHCRKMLEEIVKNDQSTDVANLKSVPPVPDLVDEKLMTAASIPKSEWKMDAPEILPDPRQPLEQEVPAESLIAKVKTKLKPQRRMRAFREIFTASSSMNQSNGIIRVRYSAPEPNIDRGIESSSNLTNKYQPARRKRAFRPL